MATVWALSAKPRAGAARPLNTYSYSSGRAVYLGSAKPRTSAPGHALTVIAHQTTGITRKTKSAALVGKRLGVVVSPSGLLFPYYLGVFRALDELGLLQDTMLAGSSGGALIGAMVQSGLSIDEAEALTESLYVDVLQNISRANLLDLLRDRLKEAFPEDIHTQVSGKLAVAVTQFKPTFQGLVLEDFTSRDDLIEAVIASCSFQPVTVRGNPCSDGLLTNFFPPLPRVAAGEDQYDAVLRVCSVPAYLRPYNWEVADVSPDGKTGSDRFGPLEMLTIAFQPSSREQLDRLKRHGYSDTMDWANSL